MPRIRILVADDYTAFRKCLFRRLNAEPDMEVIAKVANGADAVSLAKALLPDLAIIDVSMPQVNGIEAARQLCSDCPATRIMLTSAYDSERCWATLLRPGAKTWAR